MYGLAGGGLRRVDGLLLRRKAQLRVIHRKVLDSRIAQLLADRAHVALLLGIATLQVDRRARSRFGLVRLKCITEHDC